MKTIAYPGILCYRKTTFNFWLKLFPLILLFSCQGGQGTTEKSAPSSLPTEEQQTDKSNLAPATNANLQANDIVYGWVENLNIREASNLDSKILTSVQPKEPLVFTGEKSEKSQTIVLRGVAYEEPWLKVKTPDKKEGWVFGGAVKLKEEAKGNASISDTNFEFPHFGSFNLKEWKKYVSKDESGGDAGILTSTYKKGDQILIISIIDVGEYGYGRAYQLLDASRILLKERKFNFSSDAPLFELREAVKDFTVDPPIQFTRTQKMEKSHFQLNALPVMANGNWTKTKLLVKEVPENVKIQSFDADACEYVDTEAGCFC